jgi:hypothetical protein
VNYPKPGATGAIEELESLPEITAFALVGLGADAAHANRYDLAAWAFNEASTAIGNVKKAGTNADVEALLAYVTLRACETRNRARKDSNYHGAIKINRALENCGAAP